VRENLFFPYMLRQ